MPWRGNAGWSTLSAGPGLQVGMVIPLGPAPWWASCGPWAGVLWEMVVISACSPASVGREKAVMEGMLGESIVHVQEEKGFAFGACFRQCRSA